MHDVERIILLAFHPSHAYNGDYLSPHDAMRKLSLLLGTLGGAMAGYVFSNTKLREELTKAKDAEAAGKILAKHLQKDGRQVGKEIQEFVKSDAVQDNMQKAKTYVNTNAKKLQKDLKDMMKKGVKKAKKTVKKSVLPSASKPKA